LYSSSKQTEHPDSMEAVRADGIRLDNDVLNFLNQRWNIIPKSRKAFPWDPPYPSFTKNYRVPAANAPAAQPAAHQLPCAPGALASPVLLGVFLSHSCLIQAKNYSMVRNTA
jgi:hypothetical protein